MESYIDFIKKYNNEKSISSSTDSDFDNFLKGGANIIKGGFPPVYSVDTQSANDSFREYSPNLKISDVLEKNSKTPFLNINANEGGFLNLFHSESNNVESVKKANVSKVQSSSVILPDKLEVLTIDSIKQDNTILGGVDITSSSIILPENLEVISIESENKNNVQKGGSKEIINNLFLKQFDNKVNNINIDSASSIKLPSEMEIVSIIDSNINKQNGGEELDTTVDLPDNLEIVTLNEELEGGAKEEELDTTVDLPDNLEIVTLNEKLDGGAVDPSNTTPGVGVDETELQGGESEDLDTTVDLPDNLEIVTLNEELEGGADEIELKGGEDEDLDTTVDLPDNLEVVTLNKELEGGADENDLDTTVDLPDNLEIVTLNEELIGGADVEELDASVDLPNNLEIESVRNAKLEVKENIDNETSINLPRNLEVLSLSNVLDSVDTDSAVLDLLDNVVDSESISNIFLKNFK
jgi:hypothetical protein